MIAQLRPVKCRVMCGGVPAACGISIVFLLVVLAWTLVAPAQAFAESAGAELAPRFPQPKITEQQWALFQAEAMAKAGAEIIERPEMPDLTIVAVPAEYAIYYFTRRGPAHPAVIVTRVMSRSGEVQVRHNGYFAGSEEAFSNWLLAFAEHADRLTRSLEIQPGERRP